MAWLAPITSSAALPRLICYPAMGHGLMAFVTEGNGYRRQEWHLRRRHDRNWSRRFESDITRVCGKRLKMRRPRDRGPQARHLAFGAMQLVSLVLTCSPCGRGYATTRHTAAEVNNDVRSASSQVSESARLRMHCAARWRCLSAPSGSALRRHRSAAVACTRHAANGTCDRSRIANAFRTQSRAIRC